MVSCRVRSSLQAIIVRRANQRAACDQTVKLSATVQVLERRRFCCQSLHLVSGHDKLGHTKEDARRGEVGEAVDGWHAWASRHKARILKREPHHQHRRQRCRRHHP